MQPYFLPYIGYFQLINAVDRFVIYDDVNFIKKGWINRNNILVNGNASLITVPLKEASQNKLIKEIQTSEEDNWRDKFLKTIGLSYKKAPFFPEVFGLFKKNIQSQEQSITGLNLSFFEAICDYLKMPVDFVQSSSVYNNTHLKGQDRILDICLREYASDYINPIGGMELYSKDKFRDKNIKLHFINSLNIEYKQFNNHFVPWLSILDVLMFNPVEEVKKLLNEYKLL